MNIINTNISRSLSLLGHNEGLYFSTLLNFGTSTGFAFDNDKWAKVIPVTSRQKHVAGGMCVSVLLPWRGVMQERLRWRSRQPGTLSYVDSCPRRSHPRSASCEQEINFSCVKPLKVWCHLLLQHRLAYPDEHIILR